MHLEEVDRRAIRLITNYCGNLKTLGFYNCGFREPNRVDDEREQEEEAFLVMDRIRRRQEEQLMVPWMQLEKLNITSEVTFF